MLAGEFVIRLFHARTATHVLHLRSRSYAQHEALKAFYEGIIDLADSYAETYQGSHGLIESYSGGYKMPTTPLPVLEELAEWIAVNRMDLHKKGETHISNIVDEIVALIQQTIYKLKFLS